METQTVGNAVGGVMLLTSYHSTYGAQVLRAGIAAGLRIDAIVVEKTPARGGWPRIRRYLKKYGLPAVMYRGVELSIYQLIQLVHGAKRLEFIEEALAGYDAPFEYVDSLNSPDAWARIARYRPTLAVSGGTRILAAKTLAQFPLGVLNAHLGLLPEYRGNHCNRWALLNDDETGITVYRLEASLDTGPILVRKVVDKRPKENLLDFEKRTTALGAVLVVDAAQQLLAGEIKAIPQPTTTTGTNYGLMPLKLALRLRFRNA